jgi:hypothetical protein
LQALAASRRNFGRVSVAGGWRARLAQRCSREVSQALPQQREEPSQALPVAVAVPGQAAGLVPERSSRVAARRAAAQLLGPGAAQHNRTAPLMRRLRVLKL